METIHEVNRPDDWLCDTKVFKSGVELRLSGSSDVGEDCFIDVNDGRVRNLFVRE